MRSHPLEPDSLCAKGIAQAQAETPELMIAAMMSALPLCRTRLQTCRLELFVHDYKLVSCINLPAAVEGRIAHRITVAGVFHVAGPHRRFHSDDARSGCGESMPRDIRTEHT
jgi:hypothetical protein